MSTVRGQPNGLPRKPGTSVFTQWIQRMLLSLRGGWQEAASVILLFLMLEIAVLSIEKAYWIWPQPWLSVVLILAVLTGIRFEKSRLRRAWRNTAVIVLGIIIAVWQSAAILSLAVLPGQSQFTAALQMWWQAVSLARPSESQVHFAIFLIALVWIIGYISVWLLLKKGSGWLPVLLGAVMITVNLANVGDRGHAYLFLYILVAFLFLGLRQWRRCFRWLSAFGWLRMRRSGLYFLVSVLCLGIFSSTVAWYTPQVRVIGLENAVSTAIPRGKNVEEFWANIFAAVPRKQIFLKSTEQEEMQFARYFDIGDNVQFTIYTERPLYWRVRAYDVYTSSDWTNSMITARIQTPGVAVPGERLFEEEDIRKYTVEPDIRSDILLVGGEFIASDTLEVSRMQVGISDTVSVVTRRPLRTDESYTLSTGAAAYTYENLEQTGTHYPEWVTRNYLQLPESLPVRVKRLTDEITKGAQSPYKKALAINAYLAGLDYTLEINTPPEGTDAVDSFLFELKEGNCAYFASAMAVMLRSAGVPARFVIGYLPGEWDEDNMVTTVKAKHFHAWPEAYFPGYGWIEVEKLPVRVEEKDVATAVRQSSGYTGYIEEDWLQWWDAPATPRFRNPDMKINFPPWFYPTLIILIAAAIAAAVVYWILKSSFNRWLWGSKGPGTIDEIYARICYLSSLFGMGPQVYETPMEYRDRIAAAFPLYAEPFAYITGLYVENRFGGRKEQALDNDIRLLKARTEMYSFLIRQAGQFRYLMTRRWRT